MDNELIQIQPEAHSKEEIAEIVKAWCNSDSPALQKWVQLKEIGHAVKEAEKILKPLAKESFLELSKGELDKKHFFGVEVTTVSTVKKNTLAKEYIFSDAVDAIQKEVDEMKLRLKEKENVLDGMKMMEINNGTATELTAGALIGEEVTTDLKDDFELKITLRKK